VDIARARDAEVGDGATSVALLAAQLLKEIKGYIEEGATCDSWAQLASEAALSQWEKYAGGTDRAWWRNSIV